MLLLNIGKSHVHSDESQVLSTFGFATGCNVQRKSFNFSNESSIFINLSLKYMHLYTRYINSQFMRHVKITGNLFCRLIKFRIKLKLA